MLVHTQTKSLVLKLNNPARVTSVIPTAKPFTYEGQEFIRVPLKVDEMVVLRNLGFKAPSPIKYLYPFAGKYTPFRAQRETAEFLTLNRRAFVLNDLGTGKTVAALWAYHFLKQAGLANKLLVVCPLSTMERTWADEVFNNFMDMTALTLHGDKDRRLKRLASEADIYILNHHGVEVIEEALKARPDIDCVIIDEIATFRNPRTKLWKALNRVIQGRHWVWGMTGTPTPNAPTDAWGQCRLLCPERVPRTFAAFRDLVMRQTSLYNWMIRPDATDSVAAMMQPSIRWRREDCIDLPPALYLTREVEMTPEQKHAYKTMVKSMAIEYEGKTVLAVNEAAKVTKLMQVACGAVYDGQGDVVQLPNRPRVDVVREIIEEAAGKVIVFVPFKSVVRIVAAELAKDYPVEIIHGDVGKSARDRIFSAFQRPGGVRVLVAQPDAMAHGLTLTEANTIVWYSAVNNQETYSQANGRVSRAGQKRTQFIVHIEGSAIERKVYERLKKKQRMQGALLEAIREGM
jgi:SNF2 family DNA or RNA helicase